MLPPTVVTDDANFMPEDGDGGITLVTSEGVRTCANKRGVTKQPKALRSRQSITGA